MKLKYAKNNILASSKPKYFYSDGQYYYFDNKGNFWMIGNSSVGIYDSKVYQNTESNKKSNIYTKEMEVACSKEVVTAVTDLGGILPNVHRLISPVVDIAYNIHATYGSVNLQRVETASSGSWQSKVCINASTNK